MADHPPLTPVDLQALKNHYEIIREIQMAHGITAKGDVCTWYPYDDDKLVVEADGLGAGTLMLVSDHYPFDGFDLKHHHEFADEHEACKAAEWFDDLLEQTQSSMSATQFFRMLKEGRKMWDEEADAADWHDVYDDRGIARPEPEVAKERE